MPELPPEQRLVLDGRVHAHRQLAAATWQQAIFDAGDRHLRASQIHQSDEAAAALRNRGLARIRRVAGGENA